MTSAIYERDTHKYAKEVSERHVQQKNVQFNIYWIYSIFLLHTQTVFNEQKNGYQLSTY